MKYEGKNAELVKCLPFRKRQLYLYKLSQPESEPQRWNPEPKKESLQTNIDVQRSPVTETKIAFDKPFKKVTADKYEHHLQQEVVHDDYEENEDDGTLYCICRQPYNPNLWMIACDICNNWYHGKCVQITAQEARKIKLYACPACRMKGKKIEYKAEQKKKPGRGRPPKIKREYEASPHSSVESPEQNLDVSSDMDIVSNSNKNSPNDEDSGNLSSDSDGFVKKRRKVVEQDSFHYKHSLPLKRREQNHRVAHTYNSFSYSADNTVTATQTHQLKAQTRPLQAFTSEAFSRCSPSSSHTEQSDEENEIIDIESEANASESQQQQHGTVVASTTLSRLHHSALPVFKKKNSAATHSPTSTGKNNTITTSTTITTRLYQHHQQPSNLNRTSVSSAPVQQSDRRPPSASSPTRPPLVTSTT